MRGSSGSSDAASSNSFVRPASESASSWRQLGYGRVMLCTHWVEPKGAFRTIRRGSLLSLPGPRRLSRGASQAVLSAARGEAWKTIPVVPRATCETHEIVLDEVEPSAYRVCYGSCSGR